MSASQTLDYDYPYSLAPDAVHETYASCVVMGFGAHHVVGGGDAHAASLFSASACRIGPCSGRSTVPGVLSTDAADAADLFHPCRVSCSGFGWDRLHAFAWVLPGGSCLDRSYRCRVNSNGGVRSEMVFIDRGHFAWTGLTPHLGIDAHRAANGILARPHARWLRQR
jgi:hypothetical protein